VPLPVEEDVPPDPADVRLLGEAAVMPGPDRMADLVQQTELGTIAGGRGLSAEGPVGSGVPAGRVSRSLDRVGG